jgi:hypothetical protein
LISLPVSITVARPVAFVVGELLTITTVQEHLKINIVKSTGGRGIAKRGNSSNDALHFMMAQARRAVAVELASFSV